MEGSETRFSTKQYFMKRFYWLLCVLITCLSVFGQLLNDGIYYLIIQNNEVEVWGPGSIIDTSGIEYLVV